MTSQPDQIQTLIASINALLGKATPRLPWVMSSEVTQQRQLLTQTRDYLQSLAKDLEAPGGWGPVDPDSGQITPPRSRDRAGEAEAAQVLQALLLEMQYLKENSLKPLRQELTSLKQQRQTLQTEISSLEAQKLTADNSQQQINQFLETLMARLQADLSQQIAENVAQVAAGQTSDQLLAETIDGELVAEQPQLHPAQRLEQLRLVQSQSDQLLLKLDTTLQTVFESLQKSVESYRDSLAEGLEQMHSLGREGEVIFHALVNHIAQQLGQDTSRYLNTERSDTTLTAGEPAQITGDAPTPDTQTDANLETLDDLMLEDDLAGLDLTPATLAALQTETPDEGAAVDETELDEAFDLPILSDDDLSALQSEDLTVLQAVDPNDASTAQPDSPTSPKNLTAADDPAAVAATDTILGLLDDANGGEASDTSELSPVSDLSDETFDSLFGDSAVEVSEGEVSEAGADRTATSEQPTTEFAADQSELPDLTTMPDLGLASAEMTSMDTSTIDPTALAEAEAWLGLTDTDGTVSPTTDTPEGSESGNSGIGDSGIGNSEPGGDATTLDSLFGESLQREIGDDAEADPMQDTVTSLAELLPEVDATPSETGDDEYAIAADNEDLLTISGGELNQQPSLDIDASLMDQLAADLQTLAADEADDPLPGAELEPLNSLLDQDELENLVADLDLAEPEPLPSAADDDTAVDPMLGDPSADESLPSLADLELSEASEPLPAAERWDLDSETGRADLAEAIDGGIDTDSAAIDDAELSTEALEGLTLEDLSGLSDPTVPDLRDVAAIATDRPITPDSTAGDGIDDLFGGSGWETVTSETDPATDEPESSAPDTLFETLDFGALGDADSFPETEGSDFSTSDSLADLSFDIDTADADVDASALDTGQDPADGRPVDSPDADSIATDDLDQDDVNQDAAAIAALADELEVGDLSPELASELESLSAAADELAAQPSDNWDGLQSDLEEPLLAELPELEISELAEIDPQPETAYLPDPLDPAPPEADPPEADWPVAPPAETDDTSTALLDDLGLAALTTADTTETDDIPSTDELSAFADALATVPAAEGEDTAAALMTDALAPEATAETDLFAGFDESFGDAPALDADDDLSNAALVPPGGGDQSSEQPDVVWCLGLDVGTTGLSAVLMEQTTGQVYPLYWLTDGGTNPEEKWFRLPMAVWLSAHDSSADVDLSSETVGQLAWAEAQQPEAEGLLLTGLKPLLKVAVSYQDERREPEIQWSDTTVLPLQQIELALQQILRQCQVEDATPLRCETIGLESEELRAALQTLQAVVVGYPTNWPDTYSFNLREAVLAAGLVSQVEQIFFIEDAIATLLSGLPDPNDTSAVTTARQPSLYNCNWQGGTLSISAGASLTELALVNLPDNLGDISYDDFGQRSFPYAGDGLDQDVICQLLAAEGARQPLTGASDTSAQDWSWRAELPAGADGRWESLQLESLKLPAAGETALADRHRLQQRLQSSPLGLSLLEAARHLKLILQNQSQFQLDLGNQRWLVRRRDLESRIFLPYIQRINRHLNVLLSQQGISAQAIKQVICTGGSASLPAIARWLRQKFPNATIIQDTYASDRPQSCSRVAYGLANLSRYPQVLDVTRHQYSDYFLLMELLRVFPQQPLPVSGIMHLLEQRGINTKACQLHILALLEGHLPPGLVPTPSDRPWISADSSAVGTYQALTAAPLFTKQTNQIYVPNETQGQRLRAYMEAVVADKAQSLQEPLIAQLAMPIPTL